jgi:hypothetical protein
VETPVGVREYNGKDGQVATIVFRNETLLAGDLLSTGGPRAVTLKEATAHDRPSPFVARIK